MKVYEVVARAIVDEGVVAAFTLMGDANLELIAALRTAGIDEIRASRHEGGAVAEAEGYARATQRPALCTVTCGPGLGNSLVSLTEAVRARAPIVVLTGQPPRDDTTNLQRFDHRALARLAGAEYLTVGRSGAALDALRSAFRTARADSTTVVLDIDIDIQSDEYPWEYSYEPSSVGLPAPQRPAPDPSVLRAAVAQVRAAQRPIILAGDGAIRSGAAGVLAELAERIGALLAVTMPARGLFASNPYNVGVAGLFSAPIASELLAEADCVIAFGASLNYFTTEGGYLFPAAMIVQVDIAQQITMSTGRSADVYVQADARATAELLLAELRAAPASEGFRTREAAQAIQERAIDPTRPELDTGTADPREICEELERHLPAMAGLVVGGGHFWAFPIMHMARRYEPQLFCHYFGAIGQGLGVAIGAAIGFPDRPTVLIEGDGSVLMAAAELESLAHCRRRLLVVVLNDQAYGAEFHKLRAKGLDGDLAINPPTDIAAIARAFGCRAVTVTDAKHLGPYLAEFLAGDEPMLIDCRISRTVISAPYRRMHFGMEE